MRGETYFNWNLKTKLNMEKILALCILIAENLGILKWSKQTTVITIFFSLLK